MGRERQWPIESSTALPLWVWLLLGWVCGRSAGEREATRAGRGLVGPDGDAPGGVRTEWACTVEMEEPPRGIPGMADFRAVPGVGRARAELLIRHLWEAGAGADFPGRVFEWESIDGIGPVTAEALQRAFPRGGGEGREVVPDGAGGSGSTAREGAGAIERAGGS